MDKKQKRSIRENLEYLISGAWKIDRNLFFYFTIYTILAALIPFIGILTPKLLIGELIGDNRLNVIMAIIIGFFIISAMANYGSAYFKSFVFPRILKVRFHFRHMLQEKCMVMDFKNTEDKDVLNNLDIALWSVDNNNYGVEGVYHSIFGLLGSLIAFIGYVAIVFTLSPWVLLYMLANVSLIYFMTLKVKKYEHSKKEEKSECERKARYVYTTMADFAYGKDIRIFGISKWLSSKYDDFINEYLKIFSNIQRKNFMVLVIDAFLLLIREGIIYGYLIFKVVNGGMTIDNFTMYFITIAGFAAWMETVIKDIAHIRSQNMYINDLRGFLEISEEEIDYKYNHIPIPNEKPYEIEFRNVSFKYPNSDRYIYKNLSLKIKSGERLAIVGINGAGKTTFIKLLTRLYEPTEGEILLNEININKFNKEEYYKLFSAVFQEIKMFAFSVSENIALVNSKNINRERVKESIYRADISEKILSLNKGIDTSLLKILDEGGIELSGGENQKLALARALYKNGDIVILDEPTAA